MACGRKGARLTFWQWPSEGSCVRFASPGAPTHACQICISLNMINSLALQNRHKITICQEVTFLPDIDKTAYSDSSSVLCRDSFPHCLMNKKSSY